MENTKQKIKEELKEIEEEFSSSEKRTHLLASEVLSNKGYLNFLRKIAIEKAKKKEKLREERRQESRRRSHISADSGSSGGSCGDGGC